MDRSLSAVATIAVLVAAGGSVGDALPASPPFSFGAAFGDNMVLQRAPAKAAVYGFLESAGTGVDVLITDENSKATATIHADINVTMQPFGGDFGVRPSGTYNPWNQPLPTWKALLPVTPSGGNFTIMATCTGCGSGSSQVSITNVTFGDFWYCSGQSNMWLPVSHTYTRNETVAAILGGKYNNIRLMSGSSGTNPQYPHATKGSTGAWDPTGYGGHNGTNAWLTALQAVSTGSSSSSGGTLPLFQVGATCWYFAQRLSELGVDVPIGIADTAIGGQIIEEYMSNSSIGACSYRSGWNNSADNETEAGSEEDSILFAKQVVPFVDMTVKGWIWYQGENNMGGVKGNSIANVGYGCNQRALIEGWRRVWSTVPGTTSPSSPFGIVTLASSGSEGGPHMGQMRQAQTANYGVLPGPVGSSMENTFFAQAYDLDDTWGGPGWAHLACHFNNEGKPCSAPPFHQPCYSLNCCPVNTHGFNASTCNTTMQLRCTNACAAAAGTPQYMGGIHPRSKKEVGDRLGSACYNTVYGGFSAYTGPTLAGCTLSEDNLVIEFNKTLLAGDVLKINPIKPYSTSPSWWFNSTYHSDHLSAFGGSLLFVQTNASNFCMEPMPLTSDYNASSGQLLSGMSYCPTWAGGSGPDGPIQNTTRTIDELGWNGFDSGWIMLNFTRLSDTSISVDLSPLKGQKPTAVRYAWGSVNCCDLTDPDLYVTHGCIAECPIMSGLLFPANPFMAKIVNGKCSCVAPQVC